MTEFELLINRINSNIEKYYSINPLEFKEFRSKYSYIIGDGIFHSNSFDLVYKATMDRVFDLRRIGGGCTIWIKDKQFGWQYFNKFNNNVNVWINYNDKIRDIGIDDRSLEVLTVLGMETKLCTIDNRKATLIEINNLQNNE